MRDLSIQLAGVMAIAIAILHAALGEAFIFAKIQRSALPTQPLLRGIWHNGALAWIGGGVLLLMAPSLGSELARKWVVFNAVLVLGSAALVNAWFFKGRHFGWIALAAAAGLALAGV